jgi:DNA-binding XRE family transcriptional regulator
MSDEEVVSVTLVDEVRARLALPKPAVGKAIRLAAGVTQQRMADEIGVHRLSYLQWERGHLALSEATQQRLAAVLRDLQAVITG